MANLFPVNAYCFDTNILIDLFRRKYPSDVFDTLWKNIELEITAGRIMIPREVMREIETNDDELLKWLKTRQGVLVRTPDIQQFQHVQDILKIFPRLIDPNKTVPDADPFLIALAMAEKATVVTSENFSGVGSRPKIPNVCTHFGVRYLSLVDYFRDKKWKH